MTAVPAETFEEWASSAACRGTDAKDIEPALCHRCDVQYECLYYALEARVPTGIWGGRNTDQRRVLMLRADDDVREAMVAAYHQDEGAARARHPSARHPSQLGQQALFE